MLFSLSDYLNLLALFIGMAGTFLMFYYSPIINSQVIIYRKEEAARIKKRDDRRNKMIRRGMLLLFISFILQTSALFLSVAFRE